jgi:hypothetical protein
LKTFLPNLRFLALASQNSGTDWPLRSQEIDDHLEALGYELSEESVFLIFSSDGACLVARPVIGPKIKPGSGPLMFDWKASEVIKMPLNGLTLSELLAEVSNLRAVASKDFKNVSDSFFLVIQRRLSPNLKLSAEVIFHE